MPHIAKFKFDRYNTIPCTVIKKSLYFRDYLIRYTDPQGGISYEWAESFRVIFDKRK